MAEGLNTHDAEKETDEKDYKDGDSQKEESESAFTMVYTYKTSSTISFEV
jgi:hypothetical protein